MATDAVTEWYHIVQWNPLATDSLFAGKQLEWWKPKLLNEWQCLCFPADCFAHWILRASGKGFRSDDSMVPVDNKMIISFLFLTNICLVLEAWLAAASSVWNALELMFQWHKLGKADHWRLFQWKAQVWRKCSVCAANICLNKEALFYQNGPEDHNNGILMWRLL